MRTLILLFTLVFLLIPMVAAEESGCPADRAAKEGHKPFSVFHEVLAPVWHNAWPTKDYDALLASGPKFAEAFEAIAKMEVELKTKSRTETFLKLREEFAAMTEKFAKACASGDKELAYEIMPGLHDAFEMTASSLLPVYYPHFEGIIITVNLILESHLPADNMKGIIGSTETLVAKMEGLNEESIPEELNSEKKDIVKRFEKIKQLVAEMKECCDKNDMEKFRQHATALSKNLVQFAETYI